MKGVKMNYNKRSWEEIEIPDGAAIQTDPPTKIFRCAGCGKRMSGGHTSLFLKNMNFVGFKVCHECNVRQWNEDSEGYEDEVEDEEEYEEFKGEWGTRKEEYAAVRKEALERQQRGEHVEPFFGGVFAIHDIMTKEEYDEMTNKVEESFLEEREDEMSKETQELLYSKNFLNVIQETCRDNPFVKSLLQDEVVEEREKKKAIQCMYCGEYSANANHVCDACKAKAVAVAVKKLEEEKEVSPTPRPWRMRKAEWLEMNEFAKKLLEGEITIIDDESTEEVESDELTEDVAEKFLK